MPKIAHNITALARCCFQFRNERLEPHGVKGPHASTLLAVCRHPGISQDALAQRVFLNKSNIARQVAVLEEGGLVERRPDPDDKRAVQLFPTEKGLALLPQIRSVFADWEARLTAGLSEEEIDTLAALLIRLKQNAAVWLEET